MKITRISVATNRGRWLDTSFLRMDGKTEYREKAGFGNRHAVFEEGAFVGDVHRDLFNATDFPVGTIRHAANYVEEKTGIPELLTTAGIMLGGLYVLYRCTR